MTVTSRELQLGSDSVVGLRFTNLEIPRHSTIEHAHLEVFASKPSQGDCALSITAEISSAGSSATLGATEADLSSRPQGTASVLWSPVDAWMMHGEKHRSPDLVAVIAEVALFRQHNRQLVTC